MKPSVTSMVDEMVKISAWEPPNKAELKSLVKSVGAYGLGLGVGSALGFAAKEKLLPKLLPHFGPKMSKGLLYGTGAIGGLASAAAMKKMFGDSQKAHDGS